MLFPSGAKVKPLSINTVCKEPAAMEDVREQVVKAIFAQPKIDAEWSIPIQRGFAWWGYHLRQRIWSPPGYDDSGIVLQSTPSEGILLRRQQTPLRLDGTLSLCADEGGCVGREGADA
jgi:hypothetical protein